MKKFTAPLALALAALMILTTLAPSAAVAMEPFAKLTENLEADRRSRGGDRGRRPPPRPDNRRHDRDRDRSGGRGFLAGAIMGTAIAGLIAGAIADSRAEPEVYYEQPEVYYEPPQVYYVPAPAPQPVLVCDSYGNCWYQ